MAPIAWHGEPRSGGRLPRRRNVAICSLTQSTATLVGSSPRAAARRRSGRGRAGIRRASWPPAPHLDPGEERQFPDRLDRLHVVAEQDARKLRIGSAGAMAVRLHGGRLTGQTRRRARGRRDHPGSSSCRRRERGNARCMKPPLLSDLALDAARWRRWLGWRCLWSLIGPALTACSTSNALPAYACADEAPACGRRRVPGSGGARSCARADGFG